MNRRPTSNRDRDDARDARIRTMRKEREAPRRGRRTFQPLVLIAWFAGVIALSGVLIVIGLLTLAPRLMEWVGAHPGTVDNGLVQSFVEWYRPAELADLPAGGDGPRVTVEVVPGATDAEIGVLLFEKGLVSSELAFHFAVLQAGRSGDLQAGVYDLSPSLTPSQIVSALRQQPGAEMTITIREGLRLEEIVAYLATTKLTMNLDELADIARHPPSDMLASYDFLAALPPGRTLEGYLYPDTYRVDANATARQLIDKLLGTFDLRLTPEIRDQIAATTIAGVPMTIDQAVILASIVEREAVLDTERPTIAGAYLNRLNTHGWRLDADPTLQYGAATLEHGEALVSQWRDIAWWTPLQVRGVDLILPDALIGYQTYLHDGLPPAPISAPRIASIAGVAAADIANGYFFFVAGCPNGVRDGSHYFAVTLGEHNANVARANGECPAP